MRDEGLYFEDIVEAADALAGFLEGVSREDFAQSDLIRSAVIHKLQIIGEAAAHVSAETREAHPEVEWAKIVAFRNFAVHVYFAVDWNTVWVAATLNAPIVRDQAAMILGEDAR